MDVMVKRKFLSPQESNAGHSFCHNTDSSISSHLMHVLINAITRNIQHCSHHLDAATRLNQSLFVYCKGELG
jgi:hypothetical protein